MDRIIQCKRSNRCRKGSAIQDAEMLLGHKGNRGDFVCVECLAG